MFELGSVVAGKYKIDGDLGKGGMGKVVSATHLQLGTRVALKYLNATMADDVTIVARFLREARAAAQLRSEHICHVLDFGREDDVPYIVMELLEGTDLAQLVKDQVLDVATAVDYVRQACVGLAEAHAQQIVHRDLKPGNLFLTRRTDGTALIKVFDFGVAKAPDNGQGLTSTIHMVGSPAYMSPEQIVSSKDVDTRSDVWALGVILYRLVSGRIPFDAINVAQLAMQIVEEPMPLLTSVPPDFAAVVARCLEKDPAARYATVADLSVALRSFGTDVRDTGIFTKTPAPASRPIPVAVPKRAPTPASTEPATVVGKTPRPPQISVHEETTVTSTSVETMSKVPEIADASPSLVAALRETEPVTPSPDQLLEEATNVARRPARVLESGPLTERGVTAPVAPSLAAAGPPISFPQDSIMQTSPIPIGEPLPTHQLPALAVVPLATPLATSIPRAPRATASRSIVIGAVAVTVALAMIALITWKSSHSAASPDAAPVTHAPVNAVDVTVEPPAPAPAPPTPTAADVTLPIAPSDPAPPTTTRPSAGSSVPPTTTRPAPHPPTTPAHPTVPATRPHPVSPQPTKPTTPPPDDDVDGKRI